MMKLFSVILLLGFLLGLLPQLPTTARAENADAAPSPSPDAVLEKISVLAKTLVDAPDEEARHRLLAAAPPALAEDERLRRKVNMLVGSLVFAGEYDRAATLYNFVRGWCEEHRDLLGVALTEWGEGNIEGSRGNNRTALEHFERASRFFVDTGDTRREAGVLANTSMVQIRLGDYRQALAGLERALVIHRAAANRDSLLSDLQAIGNIYLDEGQPERADGYYDEAMKEADGDEAWEVYLFQNMADSRAARGDLPGAITLLEKTLALARKLKDQPRVASSLTQLGGDEAEVEHLDTAEELFREALSLAESLGEKGQQAVALIGLGHVVERRAERTEALTEALALAERASILARETGNASEVWQARTLAGHLLRLEGRGAEARVALAEAITAVEDTRSRLSGGDVQAMEFFQDKIAPFQEMVALLVGENRPAEALAFAERAKARVLLEVLSGSKNGFDEMLSPTERDTLKKREQEIASLNKELATIPAAKKDAVETRLRDARLARQTAEDDALAAHPELRRQLPLQEHDDGGLTPVVLGSLLGNHGDGRGTAFLEYVVTTNETFAFVVRRGVEETGAPEVRAFRLSLGRATLAERTEHYRRTLANRGLAWWREARSLGDDLLGKIRPALDGAENVIIVPDDSLWELPFQTLPDSSGTGALRAGNTLAARRLSFSPSLAFMFQAHARSVVSSEPPTKDARLLAFGDPATTANAPVDSAKVDTGGLLGEEFGALPDARQEVQALGKLYGAEHSRVFVGKEASEATFRQEAGGLYDVMHFATHGVYNDRAPLYSHLILSQVGLQGDEDGLLEAWKLMRLRLHARLVVLSACETARGRIGAGEGVLGLSWALFIAGCPTCVVSQWKVDSASNTALMVEFHRRLRTGANPAQALRQASLTLAKQPGCEHPFYWAPFVVIGSGD